MPSSHLKSISRKLKTNMNSNLKLKQDSPHPHRILVTGGAGFIGSNLVRLLVREKNVSVINLDKLTYAGNLESLSDLADEPNYTFVQVDLCDADAVRECMEAHRPDAVMHLAAESHVDRSIDGPGEFIQSNVIGTFNLLQASLAYWRSLPEAGCEKVETCDEARQRGDRPRESVGPEGVAEEGALGALKEQSEKVDKPSDLNAFTPSYASNPGSASDLPTKESFRFLHVSTDEVYGSLEADAAGFSETTAYDPHSPYSASKAASDHLARAWAGTYGLPVLVTNCSNNYGPYQFPEKLIPVVILKCLRGESIPVYGKGENIRDWLYVTDHAEALYTVLTKGRVGETYNIGGNNERQNIDLIKMICEIVGEEFQSDQPSSMEHPASKSYQDLITFVTDRPGHDMRYAIDARKIRDELGWEPKEDFKSGFRKTVQWYLENTDWWQNILSGDYQLDRLGKS